MDWILLSITFENRSPKPGDRSSYHRYEVRYSFSASGCNITVYPISLLMCGFWLLLPPT